MEIMEFHKYKISGNHLTNIYISRVDGMNRFFIQKSILWTNYSNEANNDNDHKTSSSSSSHFSGWRDNT